MNSNLKYLYEPEALQDLIWNNQGYSAILFTRETCGLCHMFMPTFIRAHEKLSDKYSFYIYRIETDESDDSETTINEHFDDITEVLKADLNGTPTLIVAYGTPTKIVSVPFHSVMTADYNKETKSFGAETLMKYMNTFTKYF